MSSLNRVFLIGRVVAQPELGSTASGTPLARFRLAVDRPKGKDGAKETDFLNIVAWQRLSEFCGEHLRKGKLICVTGSIHARTYETKEGQKRKDFEIRADEVEMLDLSPRESPAKIDKSISALGGSGRPGDYPGGGYHGAKDFLNGMDDGMGEVPF